MFRFQTLFSRDSDYMPRVWTGKEDIRAITKAARLSVSINCLNTQFISIIQYFNIMISKISTSSLQLWIRIAF